MADQEQGAMDVDGQESGSRKRRLVDPEGKEVQETKKPRIELDLDKKIRILKAICISAAKVYTLIPSNSKKITSIPLNIQVANVIFTCHTYLRQSAQEPTLTRNVAKQIASKDFTLTINGKETILGREATINAVKDAFNECGFQYKKYEKEDRENWYGMAGPYLDFFVGLGCRIQELRLGHDEMTIRKERTGQEVRFKVANYGIMPSHHVLLEGIGFPPEKRASMAQSVGPLTALLCYLRSEGVYKNKWETACVRSMGHIPYIKDLVQVLKGKTAYECSTVITSLADTLLIAGSRNAHRIFFPIMAFAVAISKEKSAAKPFGVPDEEKLKCVNFSGDGAFAVYKEMCTLGTFSMNGEMTDSDARQILYHGMFGTFKEDLNLLKIITNFTTWKTRSEMGNCFRGMGKSEKEVTFNLIQQTYYSKLASANISGLLSSSYTQLSYQGVFSGKRVQNFSKEFYEAIGKGMGISAGLRTLDDLQNVSRKVLREVVNKIKTSGNRLEMGTVEWRMVRGLTFDKKGDLAQIQIPSTHKFFLGNSEDQETGEGV